MGSRTAYDISPWCQRLLTPRNISQPKISASLFPSCHGSDSTKKEAHLWDNMAWAISEKGTKTLLIFKPGCNQPPRMMPLSHHLRFRRNPTRSRRDQKKKCRGKSPKRRRTRNSNSTLSISRSSETSNRFFDVTHPYLHVKKWHRSLNRAHEWNNGYYSRHDKQYAREVHSWMTRSRKNSRKGHTLHPL